MKFTLWKKGPFIISNPVLICTKHIGLSQTQGDTFVYSVFFLSQQYTHVNFISSLVKTQGDYYVLDILQKKAWG